MDVPGVTMKGVEDLKGEGCVPVRGGTKKGGAESRLVLQLLQVLLQG